MSSKKRVKKVLLRFVVSMLFCLLLITVGVKVGEVWYSDHVLKYGEFTLQRVLDMNITGLANSDYGTYALICMGLWILSALTALYTLFLTLRDLLCIRRVCIKCPKYLSCKRIIKVERTY